MGITILPPDVVASCADFTLEDGKIRFGLGAVKNVGKGAIAEILRVREAKGSISSLHDLCRLVDLGKVNRRVIESLIGAGACDSMGGHRAQLMAASGEAFSVGQRAQRERLLGQESLFGAAHEVTIEPARLPETEPWDSKTRAAHEKEFLGFYLSEHPLRSLRHQMSALSTADASAIQDMSDGADVRIVGIVTALKRIADRKGKPMAFVTLEDFSGHVEVVVFADACGAAGEELVADAVVMVVGKISTRENEEAKIVASTVMALERAQRELVGAIEIELEAGAAAGLAEALDSTLARHPGSGQIIFKIRGEAGDSVRVLAKRRQVALTGDLIREVGELVGSGGGRVRLRRRELVVPGARSS
jgi:DNA polymerase-3 subunit alpha